MFYYITISEKVQGTLTSLCENAIIKTQKLTHKNGGVQMQNVAVLFEQAAEQFAAAYPENGPLSPWITEQLGVTEPYLRGKAGVALLLLRLVQRQLTGNPIPLCRDMLPIEDRAAAVPELESVQIWWHRWLGCGIGMGFSGWESLWQAADEALQLLPETLPALCCAEILRRFDG